MTIIDFGILIIVGLAGFSCYRVGFTRSIWGVFALGMGLVIASQTWQYLALFLGKVIPNESISKWISILILIIIVTILTDTIFDRIHKVFEEGILGWLNSLLGLGIGIGTSVLIISLLLHFINPQNIEFLKDEVENSLLTSHLMEFGEEVWSFGQENVRKHLETE